jgi:protein mago nashi
MECDDQKWPHPNKIGKQELDIRVGNEEINFRTSKIGALYEIQKSKGSHIAAD